MTINLNSVFNAIVGYYDEISPRLVGGALDSKNDPLIRAKSDYKDKILDIETDVALLFVNKKLSGIETHCLRSAWNFVRNFLDVQTVLNAESISSRMARWISSDTNTEPFHALTSYLAIAGMQDVVRQLGMIDQVKWPDVTIVEKKIGMAPSEL